MIPEPHARVLDRRDRRRGRHRTRNRILVGVAIVVAFGLGIALGQALHDNPKPGGQETSLRTIPPLSTGNTP